MKETKIKNINEGFYAGILFVLAIAFLCLALITTSLPGILSVIFVTAFFLFVFVFLIRHCEEIIIYENGLEKPQCRKKYDFEHLSLRLRGFQGRPAGLENANALCFKGQPIIYNPSARLLFHINKKKKIKGTWSVYLVNAFALLFSACLFCLSLLMLFKI